MALWQGRSRRKPTGGRIKYARKKRKFEIGAELQTATIGPWRAKHIRVRSGGRKTKILAADTVNLLDPATGKTERVPIETVVSNPANPNYVQRNIITKGATVRTPKGLARITSRPGQHGTLNAVLLKEE
ncbi:MAG: 30S ribosomal protein S8e [Thermoplasmata archaeon]|nr:30S ribosomal protein S8e [Thermoplasmata archaeon]